MRFTLPANSGNRLGRTYFLSPQMRRLRHSVGLPRAKRSRVRSRSRALSLTVSTVWKGSAILTGPTRFPSRYLPSQMSSVTTLNVPAFWRIGRNITDGAGEKRLSFRPVNPLQRDQRSGLWCELFIVLEQEFPKPLQIHELNGHRSALGLVERFLCEAAGAHVKAAVTRFPAAKEASNFGRVHLPLTMLHLDEDPRLLETQPVGRGEDVYAAIRSDRGDSRAITHRTQDAGEELLHVVPPKLYESVLSEALGFRQRVRKDGGLGIGH